MSEQPRDDVEQELQQQQIDRLFLNARIFIRQGRVAEAQAAIDELRQLRGEEDAEVWELQGDLLRQQGKRTPAREAYKRAFELDPANADAERKYAELVLFLGEEERAKRRQREVIEDPQKHKPHTRNPTLAIIYACLFPGFGQLYNRQHEKGLGLLFGGAVILMLLVNYVFIAPVRRVVAEAGRHSLSFAEQFGLWGDQLRQIPWYQWLLVILGILGFVGMHLYAIADAALVARREAKEADRLGVDAPA